MIKGIKKVTLLMSMMLILIPILQSGKLTLGATTLATTPDAIEQRQVDEAIKMTGACVKFYEFDNYNGRTVDKCITKNRLERFNPWGSNVGGITIQPYTSITLYYINPLIDRTILSQTEVATTNLTASIITNPTNAIQNINFSTNLQNGFIREGSDKISTTKWEGKTNWQNKVTHYKISPIGGEAIFINTIDTWTSGFVATDFADKNGNIPDFSKIAGMEWNFNNQVSHIILEPYTSIIAFEDTNYGGRNINFENITSKPRQIELESENLNIISSAKVTKKFLYSEGEKNSQKELEKIVNTYQEKVCSTIGSASNAKIPERLKINNLISGKVGARLENPMQELSYGSLVEEDPEYFYNSTDVPQTYLTKEKTTKVEETFTWNNNVTVGTEMELTTTMEIDALVYATTMQIRFQLSFQYQHSWGGSTIQGTTVTQPRINVVVPPGKKYKFDRKVAIFNMNKVPFVYTQDSIDGKAMYLSNCDLSNPQYSSKDISQMYAELECFYNYPALPTFLEYNHGTKKFSSASVKGVFESASNVYSGAQFTTISDVTNGEDKSEIIYENQTNDQVDNQQGSLDNRIIFNGKGNEGVFDISLNARTSEITSKELNSNQKISSGGEIYGKVDIYNGENKLVKSKEFNSCESGSAISEVINKTKYQENYTIEITHSELDQSNKIQGFASAKEIIPTFYDQKNKKIKFKIVNNNFVRVPNTVENNEIKFLGYANIPSFSLNINEHQKLVATQITNDWIHSNFPTTNYVSIVIYDQNKNFINEFYMRGTENSKDIVDNINKRLAGITNLEGYTLKINHTEGIDRLKVIENSISNNSTKNGDNIFVIKNNNFQKIDEDNGNYIDFGIQENTDFKVGFRLTKDMKTQKLITIPSFVDRAMPYFNIKVYDEKGTIVKEETILEGSNSKQALKALNELPYKDGYLIKVETTSQGQSRLKVVADKNEVSPINLENNINIINDRFIPYNVIDKNKISFKGVSDIESFKISVDTDKQELIALQTSNYPIYSYFGNNEYANIKIYNESGKLIKNESIKGNETSQRIVGALNKMPYKENYIIEVTHKEANGRLIIVGNEKLYPSTTRGNQIKITNKNFSPILANEEIIINGGKDQEAFKLTIDDVNKKIVATTKSSDLINSTFSNQEYVNIKIYNENKTLVKEQSIKGDYSPQGIVAALNNTPYNNGYYIKITHQEAPSRLKIITKGNNNSITQNENYLVIDSGFRMGNQVDEFKISTANNQDLLSIKVNKTTQKLQVQKMIPTELVNIMSMNIMVYNEKGEQIKEEFVRSKNIDSVVQNFNNLSYQNGYSIKVQLLDGISKYNMKWRTVDKDILMPYEFLDTLIDNDAFNSDFSEEKIVVKQSKREEYLGNREAIRINMDKVNQKLILTSDSIDHKIGEYGDAIIGKDQYFKIQIYDEKNNLIKEESITGSETPRKIITSLNNLTYKQGYSIKLTIQNETNRMLKIVSGGNDQTINEVENKVIIEQNKFKIVQ